jgi:mercuric ion transport protein
LNLYLLQIAKYAAKVTKRQMRMAHATRSDTAGKEADSAGDTRSPARWVAAGSILGALATSSCCLVPLLLFSLGISGAWIASFTALAPYNPYFAAVTLALLGYGYYLAYVKPKQACIDCSFAQPLPGRIVKSSLWIAAALVAAALSLDFAASLLLQ